MFKLENRKLKNFPSLPLSIHWPGALCHLLSVLCLLFILALPAWAAMQPSAMPYARSDAFSGVINGVMYVAGGNNGSTDTATLQAYDPLPNSWSSLAPMPAGRYQGASGVINGKLYVAGGWDNTSTWLPHNTLYIYDPATNAWTSGANMPTLSGCGTGTVVNGKLYVTSPCNGYSGWTNNVHVYDPSTNSWAQVASMPSPHTNGASGAINGRIYIAGGYDGSGNLYSNLDVYDPATNTWSALAPMPAAVAGASSAVIGNRLYIMGGSNSIGAVSTVYIYDPATNTWSNGASLSLASQRMSAGLINGRVYLAGGVNSSGSVVSTVEAYTLSAYLVGGSIQGTPLSLTSSNAIVTTIAGLASNSGSVDGSGTVARFYNPYGITTDGKNLFIADSFNHTVRQIVIATGAVSTIAGSPGNIGSADGIGSAARFYEPKSITTDGTSLFVADFRNHTIRKIVIATGVVTTFAGSAGSPGSTDGVGSAARFNTPIGITTDGTNLFIADTYNYTIRKIVISTAAVSTLAGSAGSSGSTNGIGSAARFWDTYGITTDGANLFVTDTLNHTIRKIVISTATVSTLAGSAGSFGSTDGTGSVARFFEPMGISTDGTYLYIGDNSNNTIRKIVISTAAVSTLAGSAGSSGSIDGSGLTSRFYGPMATTTDGSSLFVSDYYNQVIRKISPDTTPPTGTISINSGAASTNSTSVTLTLSCTDASGCAEMQFSNDNMTWSAAEAYFASRVWTLAAGEGTKTVYVKFKDTAGNWSAAYSDTILFASTYTVSPTVGGSGTISPGTPQVVTSGSTVTFTLTPNIGNQISSVTGCGGTLTGNTYVTGPITANCAVIAVFSSIDLRVSSITGPASGVTGTNISVSSTVTNSGAGTSSSSYLYFYLSTDATITSSDRYIGYRSIGSLAGGASSSATTSLNIPLNTVPGTYYIGAIADATGTNMENNEANNAAASAAMTVTSGIDLTVTSITGPASGMTGSTVSVSSTVANSGTGTSSSSYLFFYLSTDATITSADKYIGLRSIGSLAGGASSSATTSLNIPLSASPGTYYIGAIADGTGTNPESDETNNTGSTASITVTSGIDLTVSSISGPASGVAGATVPVSSTVTNNGTVISSSSYLYFYLSTDAAITSSDKYIGYRSIGGLAGGASSSATTSLNIPLSTSPGTYYIGAIADTTGTNSESDETNNTGATASITVTSGIDLTVSSISGPASGAAGATVPVPSTVTNNGTVTSSSSYLYFYLSTDATITSSDKYIGYRSIGGLAGGASSSATTSLNIPMNTAAGTYYIGAIADATGINPERDEANNTGAAAVMTVTNP